MPTEIQYGAEAGGSKRPAAGKSRERDGEKRTEQPGGEEKKIRERGGG